MLAPQLVNVLVERRMARRLSLAALAKQIGVHHEALSKWERREVNPRLHHVVAWAEELGFDGLNLGPAREPSSG